MAKEYIDREAAKQELLTWARCINHPERLMTEDAIYVLDTLPAADVAPVRHGRWKYYHKQGKAVCTNCSFERDVDANFGRAVACPNCGAKMDLED